MKIGLFKVRGGLALQRRSAFLRMLRLAQAECGLGDEEGTLQVIMLPREPMAEMNWQHLKHEGATDVLTFDFREESPAICDEDAVVAEVYICPEVAVDYACEHGLDASAELALYAIHGMLHLSGQDDIEEHDRLEMRRKEALVMDALRKHGVSFDGFLDV